MVRPRVKICCIASIEEARLAVACGADALGFVSEMATGPGVIPEELIAEIAPFVPPPVARVLLTSAVDVGVLARQAERCRADVLQIVDHVGPAVLRALRAELPQTRVMPVVHVTGWEALDLARQFAHEADALLLDSGNPNLPLKELGGTGRVHDWAVSRAIVEAVPVPVFLAGGLRADNVARAMRAVRPFGLDVCSGVRTAGRLDPAKLDAFTTAVADVTMIERVSA